MTELTQQGHIVKVLTGLPDYATGKIPEEYRWSRRRKENVFDSEVQRVPMVARHKGILCRVFNYTTFMLTSSFYTLFCKKPEIEAIFVYQTSPVFQAMPGVVLKHRTKKKLVLYCCDLWPESLKAWGVKQENPVYKIVGAFSGWLYRQCDVIAVTSRPFRQYLTEICDVKDEKIVYLPQHCEDDYAEIACQYEDNDCVDFLFAGNVGSVQDVDVILKATALVQTDKRFQVHIVGDGSELQACKTLSETLELEGKAVFHGRYPLEEMNRFYKMADCFLLTLRGGDFIGMTLPSKAQSYLCAGKPILAAIDGAGRELVAEADCGEVVHAGQVNDLAEKMLMIVEHFDRYKKKGHNGRIFYNEHFTKKVFINHLLSILKGND